jgi:hypothetical protein
MTRILAEVQDPQGRSRVRLAPLPTGSSERSEPARRRTRLSELDSQLLCSIIGTCLSTGELRRLVPRLRDLGSAQPSDLDIHHAAVELAREGGPGAKALHKALDVRHELAIRQFRQANNAAELLGLWQERLRSGDIPGAYWAVMSHPETDAALRALAFGEIHMLSHLVGAANRADIRRLVALEQENAELKEKVGRQQARLQEQGARHEHERQRQAERAAAHLLAGGPGAPATGAPDAAAIDALKAALAAAERALVHQTRRRELAEQSLENQNQLVEDQKRHLQEALRLADALQAEVAALGNALSAQLDAGAAQSASGEYLRDKRIVYVGGRPGSSQAIKSLVESAGGELVLHDGGIEDRKGLLANAVPSADLVVFPVDCIDHDSMGNLKRTCERHGIAFHPIRTASLASFSALVAELAVGAARALPAGRHSHFCLRHG